ncbi:extracellular solute-binding protein [Gardnerella sp. Marseille-Q2328]|uniref:extracellular solute-binding protein n=1 Tax=Gardnerella sp. Marseille-Q2328 TaxID=2759694 RepID=UPI002023F1FD|nr:extracellular solute-binding protein [Gardnerella sp. Marseille-Q2328]
MRVRVFATILQLGKRLRRLLLLVLCVFAITLPSGCSHADARTSITVWSWEPSMKRLAAQFERLNPDVHVVVKDTSGYNNLNSAIQDGYGMPDVAQLEYFALPQYAVSGQLLDITDRVQGTQTFYTPGTWSSVQLGGRVYGLPMDSGPMAWFYNDDVFKQAGVDATQIHTWEDYRHAARKLKDIGVYIAADSGDASFYNAMIWLAGGKPFITSHDGKTVTVRLGYDKGTQAFTKFWQSMIDEGLIDARTTTWTQRWKNGVGAGKIASVFAGAWMPSLLLENVPGTAGLWKVAQVPTLHGEKRNAEMGGSALSVLQSSRKPEAAMRFVNFVCHDMQGINTRVSGGAFPADVVTLGDAAFLNRTTIRDSRGIDIPYFGGQKFNRVFAEAANRVSTGYRYLPFEVYSRSDFRATVGQAYDWSRKSRARLNVQEMIDAGITQDDGSQLWLPDDPGPRISLKNGLKLWRKDLQEYGYNQGFIMR